MKLRHLIWNCCQAVMLGWLLVAARFSAAQIPLPEGMVRLPEPWPLSQGPPPSQAVARQGMELMVDTRWADDYGYRPIKFLFTIPQAAATDIQLLLRLSINDGVNQQNGLQVEETGMLRKGETSATIILRAPQYETWNFLRWDVWIDGAMEPALSLDPSRVMSVSHWQQGGMTLYYPQFGKTGANFWSNTSSGETMGGMAVNRSVGPLRANWLDYTCFDFVVMTHNDFIAAANNHPDRIESLSRWIAAGGNLWIEDAGESTERLHAIDEQLQLIHALTPPSRDSDPGELPPGWTYAKLQVSASETDNQQTRNADHNADPTSLPLLLAEPNPEVSLQSDSRNWLVERAAGLGTVTAFAGKWDDIPNGLQSGLRRLVRDRWRQRCWLPRHGFAPNIPSPDFANFLIPGVGLAPVIEFQVLITIFVLLIGPLNYWVLSRAKRLYLLVVTVPLGAAAVTLLLFSYAFLSDGFTTQVRARSFTLLDQPAGEAASWSRFSYYAGFAPAEGLRFPEDAAIYPIPPAASAFRSRLSPDERVIEWRAGEQDFAHGWLQSRTPTQFLAVRSHESPAQLEVRAATDRCQVTNRLGAALSWLLVHDEQGKQWHGTEIDIDEREALRPVESVEVLRLMRETLTVNKPQLPSELQEANASQQNQRPRRGRGRFGANRFADEPPEFRLYSSLMERRFEAVGEFLGGASHGQFPPRSYLAVATSPIDMPLGLEHLIEVDGFHLIVGHW